MKYDIAIIGGGLIGLACAWRLAQEGAKVAIFERGKPGQEASWAGAGMLAAQCEAAHYPITDDPDVQSNLQAGFEFGVQSRAMYPAFAEQLLETTGIDVELSLAAHSRSDWRTPGILYLVKDNDLEAAQALHAQHLRGHQVFPFAKVDFDYKATLPDDLQETLNRALWLPEEGQVDNRKLVEALVMAVNQAGVTIHEAEPVQYLHVEGDSVTRLTTSKDQVWCDKVLLCAGAWSGQMGNLPPDCSPPVRPVAGIMLSLQQEPPLVPCIIYSFGLYLVPRRDGRLLVGATMENVGFDKQVQSSNVAQLRQGASALIPALADCALESQWAGLRPGTPDGLPILGRTPLDNLYIATGHFRNGILLTPATAQMMTDCILHEAPVPDAFRLERFQKVSLREQVYAH